jgi:hypothetical protein
MVVQSTPNGGVSGQVTGTHDDVTYREFTIGTVTRLAGAISERDVLGSDYGCFEDRCAGYSSTFGRTCTPYLRVFQQVLLLFSVPLSHTLRAFFRLFLTWSY